MTKQEQTKSNKMEQVFALWRKESKKGGHYFTGKGIVGFYQTNKENPNSPDLIIYKVDEDGNVKKPSILSLWCQLAKDGKTQYLSGKYEGRRVVGFINNEENSKRPYLSIYYSDDKQSTPEEQDKAIAKKSEKLPF